MPDAVPSPDPSVWNVQVKDVCQIDRVQRLLSHDQTQTGLWLHMFYSVVFFIFPASFAYVTCTYLFHSYTMLMLVYGTLGLEMWIFDFYSFPNISTVNNQMYYLILQDCTSVSLNHLSIIILHLHPLPLKGNTGSFQFLKFISVPWNAAPGAKLEFSSSF